MRVGIRKKIAARFKSLMTPWVGTGVLILTVALALGTFITWTLVRFIAPTERDRFGAAQYELRISDHRINGGTTQIPLLPVIDGADFPSYLSADVTPLGKFEDVNVLPRFQGTFLFWGPPNAANQPETAELRIDLPPLEVATPQAMRIGQNTYQFNRDVPCFMENNACLRAGNLLPQVERRIINVGDSQAAFYRITVSIPRDTGRRPVSQLFEPTKILLDEALAYAPPPASHYNLFRIIDPGPPGPPPGDPPPGDPPPGDPPPGDPPPPDDRIYQPPTEFRLSFATITDRGVLIRPNPAQKEAGIQIGNASCTGNLETHACTLSRISFDPEGDARPLNTTLRQSVLLRHEGLIVQGDVGAGGRIEGFRAEDGSLIVGQDIIDVPGGEQIIRSISWNEEIVNAFTRAISGIDAIPNSSHIGSLNLNSPNLWGDQTITSQSSPPEGKIWRVGNNISFNDVSVSGSGTIYIQGNATFNGQVRCAPNTRFGLVATGYIRFNNNSIACGSYTALGTAPGNETGRIFFQTPVRETIESRGIFIARDAVVLPTVERGFGMRIFYDELFARNPTIGYRETLDIIFGLR